MSTLLSSTQDRSTRSSSWILPHGWPIAVAMVGYPVWWALGLTTLVFPVMAVLLGYEMVRRRMTRVPPGFWLWVLFLIGVVMSAVALDLSVEGTLAPSGTGRYLAYAARLCNYLSVTVLLLYIGNTSEERLPRRRLISWMTWLCVFVISLGMLAIAFPGLAFQNPIAGLLPGSLVEGGAGATRQLAQTQPILGGEASPRPSAPFAYTNAWGNSVSLLLVWFVVYAIASASRRTRWWCALVVALAWVPIVYSLNRGVWIGLGLAMLYVAVRLALVGRFATLGAIMLVVAILGGVFAASPLSSMVAQRAESGHSNEVRTNLASDAVRLALTSPVIGLGSTRSTEGSGRSIAIGKSFDCPRCGNRTIGSTGQLWLVLIAQGFVGALLYVGYLFRTLWAFRHDHSPIGIAGSLVILMTLFYCFFYTALTMPLAIAFASIGLLWRNSQLRALQTHRDEEERRGRA